MDWKTYLNKFEEKVIIPLVLNGSTAKEGMITLKNGKLANTNFGKFLGGMLVCDKPLAIDYYGHIKKSTGIIDVVKKYNGIEIKSIKVPVVYWASIKNEDILNLAPELMDGFPLFKKHLIDLRGFKTT